MGRPKPQYKTRNRSRIKRVPKPNGRPPVKFGDRDKRGFEALCAMQCTKLEVCAVMAISEKTLDKFIAETYEGRQWHEVYPEKRAAGLASLRIKQIEVAMKGDTPMLKHLGINYLGQTTRLEVEAGAPPGTPPSNTAPQTVELPAYNEPMAPPPKPPPLLEIAATVAEDDDYEPEPPRGKAKGKEAEVNGDRYQ